ncbi:MAG: DNA polymerase [Magnetococcus sp. WYHC-3]
MTIVTLDFETYYSTRDGYTLKKLTTEEYVRDDRFRAHGAAISVDGAAPVWYTHGALPDMVEYLRSIPDAVILCHNAQFDGFILSEHFGYHPKYFLDTMFMGRCLNPVHQSVSLKALCELYGLPPKGDELKNFDGYFALNGAEEAAMAEYCCNDVAITWQLFNVLKKQMPPGELGLIDLTVKMFTRPILEVDTDLLKLYMTKLQAKRTALAADDAALTALRSDQQFAERLRALGVEPPTKISPKTGKQSFAFAKTDVEFTELVNHPDADVADLVNARLGVKSSIEETRCQRFIDMGGRGALPMPLNYCQTGTGRWSGSEKLNVQNLPKKQKANGKIHPLRLALIAPDDYRVCVADSAQIEARKTAWFCGQHDVVQQFRDRRDIYSEFASKVFSRPITKADKLERFVGKCAVLGLAYGMSSGRFAPMIASGFMGADPVMFTKAQAEELGACPPAYLNKAAFIRAMAARPSWVDEGDWVWHCAMCQRIVEIYRKEAYAVSGMWKLLDEALRYVTSRLNPDPVEIAHGVIMYKDRVKLPSGRFLYYTGLMEAENGFVYLGVKERRKCDVYLTGPKLLENIIQAMARDVIGYQMNLLGGRYPIVSCTHDEIICVVPEVGASAALEDLLSVMRVPPPWAEGVPLDAEGGLNKRYGLAKE